MTAPDTGALSLTKDDQGNRTSLPRPQNIWIRAFWGFDPENDGYVGYTRPADRERMLREAQPGDLALIYGADNRETARDDRRQVLGFLEIEPIPVMDVDRQSAQGRQRKIDNNWTHRWTYAIPARRAWRILQRIELKHLAPHTYTHNRARVIASRGEKLTDGEMERVLQLPVQQVNVYGEPPIADDPPQLPMARAYAPSKGVTPGFGSHEVNRAGGVHYLYMLQYEGDPAAFLGWPAGGKAMVKIGFSNAPDRRCEELNAAIPPAAQHKWKLLIKSWQIPSGAEAKTAEDALKAELAAKFDSLGGEFFLGDLGAMQSAFYRTPGISRSTIKV